MRKLPFITCLISLSVLFFPSCKRGQKGEKFINVIYRGGNNIANKYADHCFDTGIMYVEQQKYQKAKEYFKRADSASPNTPVILDAVGNTVAFTEGYQSSFEYFQRSLRVDSHFVKTYSNYGVCLNSVNNFDEAKIILYLGLKKCRTKGPDRAMLNMNLAYTCFNLHQFDSALLLLDEAKTEAKDGELYSRIYHIEEEVKKRAISSK